MGGEESVFSCARHGGLLAEQDRQGQPAIFDRFDGYPFGASFPDGTGNKPANRAIAQGTHLRAGLADLPDLMEVSPGIQIWKEWPPASGRCFSSISMIMTLQRDDLRSISSNFHGSVTVS
jgi:hypothetical protein